MDSPKKDAAPSQHGARPDELIARNDSPNLTAALALAAIGWPVFPVHAAVFGENGAPPRCSCNKPGCEHIGKHPRTPHGRNDATTNPEVIRGWWTDWPDANIAVATGPESGTVVLDEDPRNGGDATLQALEAEHGPLPRTVTARTGGGGRHLIFKHPGGYIKSRQIAPGLDCKGNGGYIVVAPSLHESGQCYAWTEPAGPTPLADLPPWLLERMRAEPVRVSAGVATVEGLIPGGSRNETLTSLAGSMRRRGMSEAAILEALKAENRERCSPPLAETEVESIAKSVGRYAPAAPGLAMPEWRPPLPLFDGPVPPAFPIDQAFTPALAPVRDFLFGVSEELQVPLDLPVMLLPPIAATAIAQKFIIEVRPGWREIAALWTLSLLDSGERKSAAFRRMTDPVMEWEKDEAERMGPDVAASKEEREMLERELQEERKKGAKGNQEARKRAIEIAQQLAAESVIEPPSLLTTDATSEAVVGMMVANGERALVASPEGDAIDVLMGRYDEKARPNLGIWLKGYSGDRVRVHRRGRPPEFLERPALSVAMTVQPEAVRGLFSSRVAHGRGLLARFFPSAPVGMVGRRRIGMPPVEERLEMAYVNSIRRLLNLPLDADGGPRIVRLCPEAAEMSMEFETRVEKQLGRGGLLGDQKAWGAKLCGGIARIAMVQHCLEVFGVGSAGSAGSALEISPETMKAALAWAPYLIEHEKIAAGLVGCDPATVVADRVLTWLERTGASTFTRRDCFTACRGVFVKEADDIDGAIGLLVELGYIRAEAPAGSGRAGGRPPSPVFDVNPLWDRGAPR